jgi:hypothetical protein
MFTWAHEYFWMAACLVSKAVEAIKSGDVMWYYPLVI